MQADSLLGEDALKGGWTLLAERSTVRFTNKTLWGLVPVKGRFTDICGCGEIGSSGLATGRLTIQTASLDTGISKRDRHLRALDFFDAETYPEISVAVSGFPIAGGPLAEALGNLTVRDKTLPVPLQVKIARASAEAIQLSARTAIDRSRWGVGGNPLGMIPTLTYLNADLTFVRQIEDGGAEHSGRATP